MTSPEWPMGDPDTATPRSQDRRVLLRGAIGACRPGRTTIWTTTAAAGSRTTQHVTGAV
jgi:hypothetical protein